TAALPAPRRSPAPRDGRAPQRQRLRRARTARPHPHMAAEQLETPPRTSGPAGPLTAPDVLLEHCIAHADRLERAALDLAVREGPLATIPARCAAFRRACRQIASNRGLDRLTVAVLGPR